jgi:pimeloyl-ACP methyl ester carboxylesterase
MPKFRPDRTVKIEGLDIHFQAALRGDGETTLVMVHGFGACLESWHDVYPALAAAFSVVRVDLKGSGFSAKPRDEGYTLHDQARILLDFLKALRLEKIVLIGHSMGGGVSLLTCLRNLDTKSGVDIVGLALIDSVGYPQRLPLFVTALRNPFTRSVAQVLPARLKVRLVLEKAFEVKSRITPDRIERYAFFLRLPGANFALARTAELILPPDLDIITPRYSEIEVPALIIWGEKDRVVPLESAHRFHAALRASRLLILPETGHVPHEERPLPVIDAITKFVKSQNHELRR